MIFAGSCQRRSARTGQSSVVPCGMATVMPVPARSPVERGRGRRRPRSLAYVPDPDWRQLAGVGGGAVDAGRGRGDVGFRGGHRQAGGEVQVADGGAAQVDGVDRQAPAALCGEEGDDDSGFRLRPHCRTSRGRRAGSGRPAAGPAAAAWRPVRAGAAGGSPPTGGVTVSIESPKPQFRDHRIAIKYPGSR